MLCRLNKLLERLVFYTAHHAVDPNVSALLLELLDEHLKAGKLPPPVYFKGCFYEAMAIGELSSSAG